MHEGQKRRIALVEVTLAVVAWGASFVATKHALEQVSPATVVCLRFAMGVVILGAAVLARGQWAGIAAPDLGWFALLGFLGVAFHQWLQSNGLVTARATTSAWIVTTTPVFVALLGRVMLRERLGGMRMLGIVVAAVGVLVVVSRGDPSIILSFGRLGAPGDALILASSANWAVFTVLSRRMLDRHPAARMMFWVMVLGWIPTCGWFSAAGGPTEIARLDGGGWLAVAFLGVCCSGLAYIFWYDALRRIPAARVSACLYLEPLVAMALAWYLGQERPGIVSLLGGALIVGGVWIVNRRPRV